MSAEQLSPELTVRDVLQQISRRIDVLETDVRALDAKVDARFDAHDARVDARFDAQRSLMDSRFNAQRSLMDTRFNTHSSQMDTRFDAQSSQTNVRFDVQDARFDAFAKEMAIRFRHLTTTVIATAGVLVAAAGACVAYLKI